MASIRRLQVLLWSQPTSPKKKASNQTSNESKPKNFWNLRPLLFSNKKLPPSPKIPSENCWWCFFARRSPQLKKILPSSAHQWLALARVDQSLPAGIRCLVPSSQPNWETFGQRTVFVPLVFWYIELIHLRSTGRSQGPIDSQRKTAASSWEPKPMARSHWTSPKTSLAADGISMHQRRITKLVGGFNPFGKY